MAVDAAQEVAVFGRGELGPAGGDEGFLGGGCVGAGGVERVSMVPIPRE